MSTITSNSTITGEIHAKLDNRSAKSVHYKDLIFPVQRLKIFKCHRILKFGAKMSTLQQYLGLIVQSWSCSAFVIVLSKLRLT